MNTKKTIIKNIVKNKVQEIPTEFESMEELGCFYKNSVNLAGLEVILSEEFTDEFPEDEYQGYLD